MFTYLVTNSLSLHLCQELFDLTITWLLYDWDLHKQFAFDILKKFKLGLLPSYTLKDCLDDEIGNIPECRQLLEEVLDLQRRMSTSDLMTPPLYISHPHLFCESSELVSYRYNLYTVCSLQFRHLRGEPWSWGQIFAHCGTHIVRYNFNYAPISLSTLHASGKGEIKFYWQAYISASFGTV